MSIPATPSQSHRPAVLLATVTLVAAGGLLGIVHSVLTDGWLAAHDATVVVWMSARRNEFATALAELASYSGGPFITSIYAAGLVIVCVVRKGLRTAAAVGVTVYGGVALNLIFKHFVARARPQTGDPLMRLSTYSFPSGHAAAATVFGGVVIGLLLGARLGRITTAMAICIVVTWVGAVCLSRLYLALHYPTDILAGCLEAIVWLMVCKLAIDGLRHRPRPWPRVDGHG